MLVHDPLLDREQTAVLAARGDLLIERGLFDPAVVSSLSRAAGELPGGRVDTLSSSIGLVKRFRSGLTATPLVELDRAVEDGLAANSGTVSLDLRQPLLEGRWRSVVTAGERAARHRLRARDAGYRFTLAERVRTVVESYWIYAAAARDLEVLERSEASARELLETTRRLIEADITPAAEIVQLEADLLAKEVTRIGGEQDLVTARWNLGLEIGLPIERIAALPAPADPLPAGLEPSPPVLPTPEALITLALERREDLQSLRAQLEASTALEEVARDALKPELDLVLVPSYSSVVAGDGADDFVAPLVRDIPGANVTFGFDLAWLPEDLAAEGALLRAEAQVASEVLGIERAALEVGTGVAVAVDALARSALRLERAEEAVRLFERTVVNEEKKLRAGQSTLIDVIIQQDRLTSARRQEVAARLGLALALAELRFATGTLVDGEAPGLAAARVRSVPLVDPVEEEIR